MLIEIKANLDARNVITARQPILVLTPSEIDENWMCSWKGALVNWLNFMLFWFIFMLFHGCNVMFFGSFSRCLER